MTTSPVTSTPAAPYLKWYVTSWLYLSEKPSQVVTYHFKLSRPVVVAALLPLATLRQHMQRPNPMT
jgi:hypothetical protein